MSRFDKLQKTLKGLTNAIARFPLTTVFLAGAAVVNAIDINTTENNYLKYLLTLLVGALLCTAAQAVYERFSEKLSRRFVLMGAALLLTLGYYLIIMPAPRLDMEISIRTAVALLALFMAFIWIPSIKSRVTFNETFMAAFKAFFISLFFAAVIFAGTSMIIAATDRLLFDVDEKAYAHAANIIFIIFAPLYFLALIPVYPGRLSKMGDEDLEVEERSIERAANCPKYLEILISYIIIPIAAVFTIILVIYIIINIGSEFWTDSLLEPMIVSYSITVILVYILASRLENKFAVGFRRIFPKVLVPIVLFQTISSVMRINEGGITHNRYYVMLFGIFATISGILFSILPVRKNGMAAAILIVLSVISVVPPVDAFTVSRMNQINLLESILERNDMLENNRIKPNPGVPEKDRQKIISSMDYLSRMEYIDDIPWLPENFNYYADFYNTFGFYQYDHGGISQFINLSLPPDSLIDIAGYDAMVLADIRISGSGGEEEALGVIKKAGKSYTLVKNQTPEDCVIILAEEDGSRILSLSAQKVFGRFEDYDSEKGVLSLNEATFSEENEKAAITLVIQDLSMEKQTNSKFYQARAYVLLKIK